MLKTIITIMLAGLVVTSAQLSYAADAPSLGLGSARSNAGASGLSNEAGSIAAGANSWSNPSGNTLIVTPPGADFGGVFVRAQR